MKGFLLVTMDFVSAVKTTKINNPRKKRRKFLKSNKPSVTYCSWHNHIKEINVMTR
jgi:hypothetical protein